MGLISHSSTSCQLFPLWDICLRQKTKVWEALMAAVRSNTWTDAGSEGSDHVACGPVPTRYATLPAARSQKVDASPTPWVSKQMLESHDHRGSERRMRRCKASWEEDVRASTSNTCRELKMFLTTQPSTSQPHKTLPVSVRWAESHSLLPVLQRLK